jgi:hypothetical protein
VKLNLKVVGVVLAVGVAALTLKLWPKRQLDPEGQVRAMVAEMVAATEKRDLAAMLEPVAESFKGPGGIGKQELKGIFLSQVMRGNAAGVFNPELEVTMTHDEHAQIRGRFIFVGAKIPGQPMDPSSALSAYDITAEVVKEGSVWKFARATYRSATQ